MYLLEWVALTSKTEIPFFFWCVGGYREGPKGRRERRGLPERQFWGRSKSVDIYILTPVLALPLTDKHRGQGITFFKSPYSLREMLPLIGGYCRKKNSQ